MRGKPEKPNLLFKGATLISMEPGRPRVEQSDVLIVGDKIASIGKVAAPEGTEIVDASGCIVLPGFVNAHLHTWQTNLRGVAGNWTFEQYLGAMHRGLATRYTPHDVYLSNRLGALTQIHAGTTTLVDWCHNNPTPAHTDAAIDALASTGIRAVFMHGSPKPHPGPGQKPYQEIPMPRHEVERLAKSKLTASGARVSMGLAILGPRDSIFDVTIEDLRLAREYGLIASAHTGGRPFMYPNAVARLANEGLVDDKLNFVHANNLTDDDMRRLRDCGATITVTAEVELAMGFGKPLTGRWLELGGGLSIGTDVEPACSPDLFAAMRLTLQFQRNEDYARAAADQRAMTEEQLLTGYDALTWATMGGARMIGKADQIGSIAEGKQADLIVIDANSPFLQPVLDPIATCVFHASPAHVDSVLIGGTFHKRYGRLVVAPTPKELDELVSSAARILARAVRAPVAP